MSIDRATVEKVSLLARLRLTDDELSHMTVQLGQVLDYVEQLAELDTTDVQPMAHAVELTNVFRNDRAAPSLPREAALSNAPKSDGQTYRVPAVLGE
ncbi:MAG: Asp-tRNA(Asn)/Glu-tRNA(Gln) amidotransferase subunit GatC [Planctomycetota bacterium]|nr:Asp-tRNA(Asn)/Glu-tRNA(Gln) amidotransferase subunit GatC [Planctomycetota bacterium]